MMWLMPRVAIEWRTCNGPNAQRAHDMAHGERRTDHVKCVRCGDSTVVMSNSTHENTRLVPLARRGNTRITIPHICEPKLTDRDTRAVRPGRLSHPLTRLSIIHTHPSMPPLALRLRVGRHSHPDSQLLGALIIVYAPLASYFILLGDVFSQGRRRHDCETWVCQRTRSRESSWGLC